MKRSYKVRSALRNALRCTEKCTKMHNLYITERKRGRQWQLFDNNSVSVEIFGRIYNWNVQNNLVFDLRTELRNILEVLMKQTPFRSFWNFKKSSILHSMPTYWAIARVSKLPNAGSQTDCEVTWIDCIYFMSVTIIE